MQHRLYFDKNDYELLRIVNEVLEDGCSSDLRSLLLQHMHPSGIKEMAAPRGLRIAYAMAALLGSLERGNANDRIRALRSLRDEVFSSTNADHQINTARVLMQIMKELVRCRDNHLKQLKLAHDFRLVFSGNPRTVRRELAKYHLLEMPEQGNQFTFDDHVHDANTKGRKSATHLLMDAWIKGIRHLTVVYYNYVSPKVVKELIESSAILKIRVQVGIEISARFRGKYIRFTWEPHGFDGNRSLLTFLEEKAVKKLFQEGQQVSAYQQRYVFEVLDAFNTRHRLDINKELQLELPPLNLTEFLEFVGEGQPSLLHLARFIQNAVTRRVKEISSLSASANDENKSRISALLKHSERFHVSSIINDFLLPSRNPGLHDPARPADTEETLPRLLQMGPKELLTSLLSLYSSSRFVLNLNDLSVQDTLELLYLCEGMISHIESYNLKVASHGILTTGAAGQKAFAGEAVDVRSPEKFYRLISDLQQALNEDNVISLKRAIRAIIWDHEERCLEQKRQLELVAENQPKKESLQAEYTLLMDQKQQLLNILYNLDKFHRYYEKRTLGSRIGSGSTGQAEYQFGMGLVILDTLPSRAKNAVRKDVAAASRSLIPVTALLTSNRHRRYHGAAFPATRGFLRKPCWFQRASCYQQWLDWNLDALHVHPGTPGNMATLGGFGRNGDSAGASSAVTEEKIDRPWIYLNSHFKNSLKILLGFIPAFLTFFFTKDWWLLAYFGAFIWFAITGSRNIIQSVLGGGGLRRSPLLPWNSLVSWSRIADSLFFTGFSVPLLDYLIKTVVLDQGLGITTSTNPILLYAGMGLANGIYISSHNIIRGLPKTAATGNFFRSILAIPLAIVINSLLGFLLQGAGIPDVSGALQKWAAIISKFSSDCVAAIIEGLADRQTNIQARLTAYKTKIAQLFAVFSRLDLQFPEEDVLEMLASPKIIMETLNYEAREQEKQIIVNALDLLYFWMYQPRARRALMQLTNKMTREEWLIFYRSQLVLKRYREISQFFIDGLVGRNFSAALSFYLDRSEPYLIELERIGQTENWE